MIDDRNFEVSSRRLINSNGAILRYLPITRVGGETVALSANRNSIRRPVSIEIAAVHTPV
jgi:hypothetical protein